jgi:hypothetical protein
MNTPNIEAHSTSAEGCRSTHNVDNKRGMSIIINVKRVASRIHQGVGKTTSGVIVRGVALGVLLAIGMGIYLGMDSGTTSEATSTANNKMHTEYRFMDLEDEPLSVDFLRTYVYPQQALR